MKKREADFGTLFGRWIRANPPRLTSHFELKQTTKDTIPFSCLEDQQIVYGESIRDSSKGVLMRNISAGGRPDYTYTYRDPVFVVIKFPNFFCIMSLDAFMRAKATAGRKTLTAVLAWSISQQVVKL